MSFRIVTNIDDGERIEELITTEHTTRKIWSKELLSQEIDKLNAEIAERQDRIIVLVAQVEKFTVTEIPKE